MAEKFYVTTPIYYVNARPHIGHAYTTIVADVLARRHRLQGDETWFLTGTDEHGQKIERSAAAAGIAPQQFADQVSASFETLWKRMGITNDQYIRTTSAEHGRGAQKLFATLYEKGKIYLSSYSGQYCVSEEMFVEGPPGTIGPDGRPTETVTEENFFFRLSEYQLPLLNLIESNTLKITPEARRNEVLSFVRGDVKSALLKTSAMPKILGIYDPAAGPDMVMQQEDLDSGLRWALEMGNVRRSAAGELYVPGALKDLSVSRSSFTWGIPVPEPAASAAKEKHVIYVWLDALANYISALGYGSDDESKFHKFWPAQLHLVGKEIIRFHCVYWPAFLMAAGLPLPKAVTAHGWLLFDDSKMSKSKGNIVRTENILDAFGPLCPPAPAPTISPSTPLSFRSEAEESAVALAPANPSKQQQDLFAADILRYFLLREIPFGQDGSFTFDALITRYNADLANGYGNLVSRTLNLVSQNLQSTIVLPSTPWRCASKKEWVVNGKTRTLEEAFSGTQTIINVTQSLEIVCTDYQAHSRWEMYCHVLLLRTGLIDTYLTVNAPWKLAKSADPEDTLKMTEVLYTAAESIRIITALLHPILPYATAQVWRQLGLGDITKAELKNLQWGGLKPGTKLGPLAPIFPRADKKLAEQMTQMEQDQTPDPNKKPLSKLVDETSGHTSIANPAGFDPAAGPRTTSLTEPNAGAQVGGSSAEATARPETPTHTEAQPSGIFAAPAAGPGDASPEIAIDDFARVELRVAKILICERIPKADKLLRLEVDLGYERRQILSGIAEWYTPEELLGRRIVVITNLAPRKMRGLESHGMLLAASTEGGKPALATFLDTDDLPLGSRLK